MPIYRDPNTIALAALPAAIIGFHAPKGTGKDTTARRLHDNRQDMYAAPWWEAFDAGLYRIDSFAAPLYRMVAELTGLSVEQLQDEKVKERTWTVAPTPENVQWAKEHPGLFTDRHMAPTASLVGWSPRKLLEHLGTEFVRDKVAPDHWVQLMKARLAKHTHGVTIITDVRFENEAAICDLVIELRRGGVEYSDEHVSRRRLPRRCIDVPDYYLTEDMDYRDLARTLLRALEFKRASVTVTTPPGPTVEAIAEVRPQSDGVLKDADDDGDHPCCDCE